MSLKKKILLAIGVFFLMFAIWWVYDAINPKPVDESLRDGGKSAQGFMEYQKRLQNK